MGSLSKGVQAEDIQTREIISRSSCIWLMRWLGIMCSSLEADVIQRRQTQSGLIQHCIVRYWVTSCQPWNLAWLWFQNKICLMLQKIVSWRDWSHWSYWYWTCSDICLWYFHCCIIFLSPAPIHPGYAILLELWTFKSRWDQDNGQEDRKEGRYSVGEREGYHVRSLISSIKGRGLP